MPLMRNRSAVAGIFMMLTAALAGCAGWHGHPARDDGTAMASENSAARITGEWSESVIVFGGRERAYRVYRPEGLAPGARVVVLLHGGSQSMRRIFAPGAGAWLAWPALADREKFLLVVPNGLSLVNGSGIANAQQWNDLRRTGPASKWNADDTGFIVAALDMVKAKYGYDATRVYATRASNGGMMTMRLLLDRPDRFAAGAAFVATLPEDLSLAPEHPAGRPLMIVDSTDDPLVPWAGGVIPGDITPMLGAEATARRWAQYAGADSARAKTESAPGVTPGGGYTVTRTVYPPINDNGAPVELWKVAGAGHFMPTRDHPANPGEPAVARFGRECRSFESAEIAWRFFMGTENGRNAPGR